MTDGTDVQKPAEPIAAPDVPAAATLTAPAAPAAKVAVLKAAKDAHIDASIPGSVKLILKAPDGRVVAIDLSALPLPRHAKQTINAWVAAHFEEAKGGTA